MLAEGPEPNAMTARIPRMSRGLAWVKTHWKTITACVAVIVALPTSIAAWSPVPPKMAVTVGAPTDRAEPFSVPFTIKNEGWLAATDVSADCYVHRIEFGKNNTIERGGFSGQYSKTAELAGGEQHTIRCPIQLGPGLQVADVAIVIEYKGVFGRSRKCARFAGAPGDPWQWQPVSCADIRAEIDAAMRSWNPDMSAKKGLR